LDLLTEEEITVQRITQAVGLANFKKIFAPREFESTIEFTEPF